jgi:hypothetical protein
MLVLRRCVVGITLWWTAWEKILLKHALGLRLYTMLTAPAKSLARRQNPRCRVYP